MRSPRKLERCTHCSGARVRHLRTVIVMLLISILGAPLHAFLPPSVHRQVPTESSTCSALCSSNVRISHLKDGFGFEARVPQVCSLSRSQFVRTAKKGGSSPTDGEDEEELDRKLRKMIGEEKYAKLVEAAEERERFHAENFVPDGLAWPTAEYPIEVPAFTRAVSAGIIGRKIVGSTVVDAVMGEEMERMQSEFNLDMHVFAVAERGVDGRGRMLLSEKKLSRREIDEADDTRWKPYVEAEWTQHLVALHPPLHQETQGGASIVVVECSGPERELSSGLWSIMSEAFERWLALGIHVCFADIDDTLVGQYLLACVMTDLEDWEALTDAYDAEEAALGLPTEPFQEGRIEGLIHQMIKDTAKPPITTTREELIDQHQKVFGINPIEAARIKESRIRAGGLEAWQERDYKSANRIGVGRGGKTKGKTKGKGGDGASSGSRGGPRGRGSAAGGRGRGRGRGRGG